MKKLILILGALAFCLALALPALAEEEADKDLTGAEWNQLKTTFLAKKPTDSMGSYKKGDRFPGCNVCYYRPRCRSGYKQTGYTDMVDYVVVDAWGAASPGPGGYVPMKSKTIVQNGVCVHDHVRAGVCDRN